MISGWFLKILEMCFRILEISLLVMYQEIKKNRESAEGIPIFPNFHYRYAFVEYEKEDEARIAMEKLRDTKIKGRTIDIQVNFKYLF